MLVSCPSKIRAQIGVDVVKVEMYICIANNKIILKLKKKKKNRQYRTLWGLHGIRDP